MAISTTDQNYYSNPNVWGENQFVTLENIIDNIILTSDDDSYFKHAKRWRASIFGKQCLKRLHLSLNPQNKAISIQLSPSKTFPYPRYMNHWIRVSVLNKCEKLTTLNVNNRATIHDYLQDNDYELLYDDTGSVLRADDFDAETGECCSYKFSCGCTDKVGSCSKCSDCTDNSFKDSWVKDNREGSYFEFSDDLVDEIIVIEFQTAGLENINDCDVKVPHVLELAVENWIRAHLLKGKRNVPNHEWKEYLAMYRLERRRAKPFLSKHITIKQILQAISLRY